MAVFVLVAGAWHGAWCWERVAPLLRGMGHLVVARDLPGMGGDATPLAECSFAGWARSVAETVTAQPERVVLVGHSRGGMVISQAAEFVPDSVRTSVYLAGLMLPPGINMPDAMARVTRTLDIAGACVVSPNGVSMALAPEIIAPAFYHATEPEWAARAANLLTPEPVFSMAAAGALSDARFGRVPRAYIECLQDCAVPLELQRLMQRDLPCWKVLSLDTDHSPFYSAPQALAMALDKVAADAPVRP